MNYRVNLVADVIVAADSREEAQDLTYALLGDSPYTFDIAALFALETV